MRKPAVGLVADGTIEHLTRFRTAPDATLVIDLDGQILDANKSAQLLIGYSREDLSGVGVSDLISEPSGKLAEMTMERLKEDGSVRVEIDVRRQTGGAFPAELSASVFHLNGQQAIQCNLHDVTHRKRNEAQLRHVATHDPLTDLPNRMLLRETLEDMVTSSTGSPSALLLIDLDGFKLINDSLGHAVGDRLLAAVGDRLLEWAGDESSVARMSGDEFGAIIRGADDRRYLERRVRDLQRALATPFRLGSQPVYVSASIGLAMGPADYRDPDDWIADVEIAMYEAKGEGRGKCRHFEQGMRREMFQRMRIESELRSGLTRQELQLHYQPIVRLDDCKVVRFEALIRWQHPRRGLLAPGLFLAQAKDAGLMEQIDLFVMESACAQLKRWNERFGDRWFPQINANISTDHFSEAMVDDVQRLVKKADLRPWQLGLEITEGAMFKTPDRVPAILKRLRNLKVKISLDDFGTGYSSLSYLQRFPVDSLKIDQSFITGSSHRDEVLNSLVALGRALDMEITAEGIESEADMNLIQSLGCDFGQGYYFSRPIPLAAAEALVDSENPE